MEVVEGDGQWVSCCQVAAVERRGRRGGSKDENWTKISYPGLLWVCLRAPLKGRSVNSSWTGSGGGSSKWVET